MIKDLSFIVIAQNEAFGVERCLEALSNLPLCECEVICVDSGSTDDTQKVMRAFSGNFESFQLISCSGCVNASAARNAGMRKANRKFVFFLDGDVAVNQDFVSEALAKIAAAEAVAVTGQLLEIQYSDDYESEIRRFDRYKYIRGTAYTLMCGGNFLTRRDVIEEIGTWDVNLPRNQDLDYTLRISRQGLLLALETKIGTHHSLTYRDRPLKLLRKGFALCYGQVLRRNIDRPNVLVCLLLRDRGLLSFLVGGSLMILLCLLNLLTALPFWITVIAVATWFSLDLGHFLIGKRGYFLTWFVYTFLRPPVTLAGLIVTPHFGSCPTREDIVV